MVHFWANSLSQHLSETDSKTIWLPPWEFFTLWSFIFGRDAGLNLWAVKYTYNSYWKWISDPLWVGVKCLTSDSPCKVVFKEHLTPWRLMTPCLPLQLHLYGNKSFMLQYDYRIELNFRSSLAFIYKENAFLFQRKTTELHKYINLLICQIRQTE
jgi:hypothetical protein